MRNSFVVGVNDQQYAQLHNNNQPDAQIYEYIPNSGEAIVYFDYVLLLPGAKLLTFIYLNSYRAAPTQPRVDISCFVRR